MTLENGIDITVETIVNLLANDETQVILCPFPEEKTWIYIRADDPLISRFAYYPVDNIDISNNSLKIWLNEMGL